MSAPEFGPILFRASRFFVTQERRPTGQGGERIREIVRHPGSVVILPMFDDGRVCLIRNFRVSVGKTLIELPAGTLEPATTPFECAQRELAEETGYRAGDWKELLAFFPAPGILDERMHLFVARQLTAGPPAREAGEEIENLIVMWDEALAMIRRGEIDDGKTILGLLYWSFLQDSPHGGNSAAGGFTESP